MHKSHLSRKKAKNRKALYDYMTPTFWHVHYLVPAAIGFMALGMALGIAHFTYHPYGTFALASDNIQGWAWTPNVGWFSLNDQNSGSCASPPCGTYGLHIENVTSSQPHWDPSKPAGTMLDAHRINGFAWSDNVGFVCFGNSCNIPACHGGFYPAPPGDAFYAYVEPVTDPSPKRLHGWGVICNQNVLGWISLSCQDTGSCTGGSTVNYQLAYNPPDKRFYSPVVNGSPFGWNGNTDGSGLGYISFYPSSTSPDGMHITTTEIEDTVLECTDYVDNDLNGYRDCSDSNCWGTAACPEICTDGIDNDSDTLVDCDDPDCYGPTCPENTPALCADGNDNDGDTLVDCDDPDCFGTPGCPEVCGDGLDNDADGFIDCLDTDCPPCPEDCVDGVDNDGDGDVDCLDADCALDPACVPPQHQCNASPNPLCPAEPDPDLHADCCCNDQDDNGTGLIDCLDPDCRGNAAACAAWLQVETGNIYALGITGTTPSRQTNLYNTKYCLRADQTIQWTSEESCTAEGVGEIKLPSVATNYRNRLGFLDLAGIRVNGRYGAVWNIGGTEQVPDQMNGGIYRYTAGGTLVLPARTFLNGSGATGNGSGLLLIEGADLQITGDISYEANPVQSRLKNLASFGVIVVKNASGLGGNIFIDPSVTKISGVYFAEGIIHTGTTGAPPDPYLSMYGIFIANQFNLQRDNNTNPMLPAERIIFDGRAVVNPPPGMEDAAKSLPRAIGVSF